MIKKFITWAKNILINESKVKKDIIKNDNKLDVVYWNNHFSKVRKKGSIKKTFWPPIKKDKNF